MAEGASQFFEAPPVGSANVTADNLNSLDMGFNVKQATSGGLDVDVTEGTYWNFQTTPPTLVTFAGASGVTLTASQTNFVYLADTGLVAFSIVSFPDPDVEDFIPLAEAVTDGSGVVTDGITDRRPRVSLGNRIIQTITFGGNMATGGNFLQSNAPADATEQASGAVPLTEYPTGRAGIITKITWRSAAADATTDLRLHVDGAAGSVIDLTGANGQVTGLSQATTADGRVECEFDAGTAPGNIIVEVEIEIFPG